jgi:hypothetical protein
LGVPTDVRVWHWFRLVLAHQPSCFVVEHRSDRYLVSLCQPKGGGDIKNFNV